MTNDSTELHCAACNEPLPVEQLAPGAPQTPCPKCGSTAQHVTLKFFDTVTTKVRDTLKGKLKDPSRTGKAKVRQEFVYGADKRHSKDDYVYKERVIDKDNNRYRELVKEEDTGEIIRDIDQPLTDHTGHGSAKFKKPPPPSED